MSEDKEKNSEDEDDLLSMVDSLLGDDTSESGQNKSLEVSTKKSKVVPVVVRPPKNLKQKKDVPIKPKIETRPKEVTFETNKQDKKSVSNLSLEELSETVLEVIDSEADILKEVSQTKKVSTIDLDLKKKSQIPSSYKIKFGTHKKLDTLKKDIKVKCPKCGHYFETLETEDIICPKCHSFFDR
ncbi:MAG: FmdB family zinc ribbon protein [Candidatus Helarchaeota archaeon]